MGFLLAHTEGGYLSIKHINAQPILFPKLPQMSFELSENESPFSEDAFKEGSASYFTSEYRQLVSSHVPSTIFRP